ncbi:hypothetical protein F4782DRAFT_532049 [Xylaria castorea]|nr:hypothetical protein F4782DRAFT_532049 [Xylaria castorea]
MANPTPSSAFTDLLSPPDRQIFESIQEFEKTISESKAQVEKMQNNVSKLEKQLEEMREAQIIRLAESQVFSDAAMRQLENSPYTSMSKSEKLLLHHIKRLESPELPDTLHAPLTPPPRPPQNGFFSAPSTPSAPSKRKASENSDLYSMKEHNNNIFARLDPIPISFDNPRRLSTPRHTMPREFWYEADDDSVFNYNRRKQRVSQWRKDDRDLHLVLPPFAEGTPEQTRFENVHRLYSGCGSMSSRLPSMPPGLGSKRTQEESKRVLPASDDYEKMEQLAEKMAREMAEVMDNEGDDDEPASDKTV